VIGADRSKARVLGEKAVARVDRVALGDQRGRDDVGNVEIRARYRPGPNAERFVGLADVQRVAIGFGKDRNGTNAQLLAGAIDS
jgi:hypothetical protein